MSDHEKVISQMCQYRNSLESLKMSSSYGSFSSFTKAVSSLALFASSSSLMLLLLGPKSRMARLRVPDTFFLGISPDLLLPSKSGGCDGFCFKETVRSVPFVGKFEVGGYDAFSDAGSVTTAAV